MTQARDKIDQDVDALKAQIEQLSQDLAAATRTIGALAENAGVEAAGTATRAVDDVRARARQTAEAVAAEVEERPLSSLLFALLAGLVLGALFSGRR